MEDPSTVSLGAPRGAQELARGADKAQASAGRDASGPFSRLLGHNCQHQAATEEIAGAGTPWARRGWWADVRNGRAPVRARRRRAWARRRRAAWRRRAGARAEVQRRERWWTGLDLLWHVRTRERRRAWLSTARRLEKSADVRERVRGRWYRDRARGLSIDRRDKLSVCGKRFTTVRCACADKRIPSGCDMPELCPACGRKRAKRVRARTLRAVGVQLAEERRIWQESGARRRTRPAPVLVTGTIRHSGDVGLDRERLEKAWRKLRNRIGHWLRAQSCTDPGCTHRGKALKPNALGIVRCTGRATFPYVLTWEMTPGVRNDGHVHWHAVVIWPWLPWDKLREAWMDATDGESRWIDLSVVNAEQAAHYVSKYASKGFDVREMPGELAGAGMAAFYGKRRVTSSRGFFLSENRTCPDCGEHHKLVQLPDKLAKVAGAALFRAACRTAGVRLATGPPRTREGQHAEAQQERSIRQG